MENYEYKKVINSLANPYIKELSKLNDSKYRKEKGLFIIEGKHLVEEAKKANLLKEVLIINDADYIEGIDNIKVTSDIIKKLTNTISPQQIVGIAKVLKWPDNYGNFIVMLDKITDPGNLGTIIRSSIALNATSIITSSDSVDLYNDKVIRATQGAIFKIPIYCCDLGCNLINKIEELKQKQYKVIATIVNQEAMDIEDLPKIEKTVLVIGSEATGISADIIKKSDYQVTIKMNENMESLNAGVAASIALYVINKKTRG